MTARFRSFPRPVQLLLLNQLTINIGFYMLMPYLATYLSGELALATWLVGLILGGYRPGYCRVRRGTLWRRDILRS